MQVNFAQKSEALLREGVSLRSAPRLAVGQPATLRWPDISRRVCRGQFLWAEARAKCFSRRTRRRKKRIGLYSRRRAANSVRLFIGFMGAFMPPFGLHVFFWRDFPESKREKVRDLYETHWSCEIFFVIIKFAVVLPFEKAALFQCQTSRRRRVYTTRRL